MQLSLCICCWVVFIGLLETRACPTGPLSPENDDQEGGGGNDGGSQTISQQEGGARAKRDVDLRDEADDDGDFDEQMRVLFPLLRTIIISAERTDLQDGDDKDRGTRDNVDCCKTAPGGGGGDVDDDEQEPPAIHILIPMMPAAHDKRASRRTFKYNIPTGAKTDGFQQEKELLE